MLSIIESAANWGRRVVITLGLKDLVEKLEEYYGKRVVKLFIGVMGIAALLFVIGLAVTQSVYPLGLWIGSIVTGQPAAMATLQGFGAVVTIAWIGIVLGLALRFIIDTRSTKALYQAQEEIRRMIEKRGRE